jgi:hypothetical protein
MKATIVGILGVAIGIAAAVICLQSKTKDPAGRKLVGATTGNATWLSELDYALLNPGSAKWECSYCVVLRAPFLTWMERYWRFYERRTQRRTEAGVQRFKPSPFLIADRGIGFAR